MTMPSADAYEPQVQMWFSTKNTKELGTFLASETYEGYTWEGSVNVMIYAPGWNTDSQKMDTIGSDDETPIGVIVRQNTAGSSGAVKSLEPCGFLETGPDTGLFYGRVKLSGTDLDANGDGVGEMGFGKSACTNLSEGTSKSSHREAAKLESSQSGALTVWWQYNEEDDQVVSKSASYSMSEAEVKFSQEYYDTTDRVLIDVTDKDMNGKPKDKAQVFARVFSDSDKVGVKIFFDKKLNPQFVFLTTDDESSSQRLYVQPGDTIYAEYDDYLMPPIDSNGIEYDIGVCRSSTDCDISDHKTILATAKINHPDQWLR
tara:strand:+ start:547 stop:1494 length:948 start_codon:yes stop_codon:yes gene_type:complete